MPTHYTRFSEEIINLTTEEKNWLMWALGPPQQDDSSDYESNDAWVMKCEDWAEEFSEAFELNNDEIEDWPEFNWDITNNNQTFCLFSEESGFVEHAVNLLCEFYKNFRQYDYMVLGYASYSDSMEVKGFKGGEVFISGGTGAVYPSLQLGKLIYSANRRKEQNERIIRGPEIEDGMIKEA